MRLVIIAATTLALLLLGLGRAEAVTTGFCEQHGGLSLGMQDGSWWCVGGLGDGQQILFHA
ncbi:hypothetical protein [Nocardia camponoti]|uniref:Uncharacterized protein n=1 Tax=Nocardia camponoti TaxID=1616106 RepID=A0A917QSV5_9NOCA|nr:hypothetical protein [Nocardia camponoti]GGK66836.1 hypothetical protein GCM10011591_43740 [Nocardia camponoti]